MARIPNPPDLGQNQSFLGWLFEYFIRLILGTWLMCQAIGFIFWSIWHLSGHGFREFMFRDFIDLWQNHSWRLPEWVGYIPTWQSPVVWVVVALLLVWWFRRSRPSRARSKINFEDLRGSDRTTYDGQNRQENFSDESAFGFKAWKWKKPSKSRELDPLNSVKTRYDDALELFGLSEPFTMAELKHAYAKLVKETHPDKGGNPALFRQVNKAFELLKGKGKT